VKNYSFIYHPLEKLHGIIPDLLPGIEKMITIHYDDKEKMIKGNLTEKRNKEYNSQSLNLDTILTVLQRYMEEKSPYDWYSRQSLPFEIEIKRKNPTISNTSRQIFNLLSSTSDSAEPTVCPAIISIFL